MQISGGSSAVGLAATFFKSKNKHNMFQLTRTNRRKTSKARHTQVIDVPLYIPNTKAKDKKIAKEVYELAKNDNELEKCSKLRPELVIKNPSAWAGKRKFIFHVRPNAA